MLSYQGYIIRADRIDYDQKTGDAARDRPRRGARPDGQHLPDGLRRGHRRDEGSLHQLADARPPPTGRRSPPATRAIRRRLQTILTEATYSPCGLCIDSKGRKIGWKVKAARMIYDREKASVTLEQPSLELLGIPVAWLPWFWMPDPTPAARARASRMPTVDYDAKRGVAAAVPYFVPVGEDIDLMLSPHADEPAGRPAAGRRQLAHARLRRRSRSRPRASTSSTRRPSPARCGDRDWRGAIQTSGRFTPVENWTVGLVVLGVLRQRLSARLRAYRRRQLDQPGLRHLPQRR